MKSKVITVLLIAALGLVVWTVRVGEAVPKPKPRSTTNKLVHEFTVSPGETVYAGDVVAMVGENVKLAGDVNDVPVGIAESDALDGERVPVVMYGIADNYVNLVPGSVYHLQPDGSLATDPNRAGIGVAVSQTELLVRINTSLEVGAPPGSGGGLAVP
jgi:hypothetical protein